MSFNFYDEPLTFYNVMLDDIRKASQYIFLETYKFANDAIGIKFRDALVRKAKQGIRVIILVDSWGTSVAESFFSEIKENGGEVKFFKKLKLSIDFLSRNHLRNHRKILVIDDKISYVGSPNITGYSINWRESVLRIENELSLQFKKIFLEDYSLSKKYFPNKRKFTRGIKQGDFEIVKDLPSSVFQPTRKKFLSLIRNAKKEIIIETPYFLPGSTIRKALINAAERGVLITIITPLHSDVELFDILRNRYLGLLFKNNIIIFQYYPDNLHAKLMLVDNETFCIGSSNFDYRSFRFMHEINLLGKNKNIIFLIVNHFAETKQDCHIFDYDKWLKRPWTLKIIELLLVPIRHFF
ncbi:MAG: phosphatidylserine/phosphatidylglycerophosphate/cardiolipin synthase family protein [Bacteroidales bacterium]|nr:phosphatidylserine/phosphatidylglycerophosphate/cardiolipin synthase family protein [Bacteroidales bacterium]